MVIVKIMAMLKVVITIVLLEIFIDFSYSAKPSY